MRRRYRLSEDRRIDHGSSLLIDAAINAALSHELIPVAEELIEQGIEPNVVLRVLTRPAERRDHEKFYAHSGSVLFH